MSLCRYDTNKPCENHGTSSRTCLDCVLDKIMAEVANISPKTYPFYDPMDDYVKTKDVLKIIDKYRKGHK